MKALKVIAHEMIQLGMAVEAGGGRDEANPADTRVHNMKKGTDVESGDCGQEKLENSELCKSSGPGGPGEDLVRRS